MSASKKYRPILGFALSPNARFCCARDVVMPTCTMTSTYVVVSGAPLRDDFGIGGIVESVQGRDQSRVNIRVVSFLHLPGLDRRPQGLDRQERIIRRSWHILQFWRRLERRVEQGM